MSTAAQDARSGQRKNDDFKNTDGSKNPVFLAYKPSDQNQVTDNRHETQQGESDVIEKITLQEQTGPSPTVGGVGNFEIIMNALAPVGGYHLHVNMRWQDSGQVDGVGEHHDDDTSDHAHEQQVGIDDLLPGRLERLFIHVRHVVRLLFGLIVPAKALCYPKKPSPNPLSRAFNPANNSTAMTI